MTPTKQQLAQNQLAAMRQELNDGLALCDRAENIIARMPEGVITHVCIHRDVMMIYNLEREQVKDLFAALSAGIWKKKINATRSDMVDYTATIDGVPIEIYAAPPDHRRDERDSGAHGHNQEARLRMTPTPESLRRTAEILRRTADAMEAKDAKKPIQFKTEAE